jgi:DNA repair protein RecN (Recombination protein N)
MALKSLALRDFVIVRELIWSLASGFTVLTGETGAGKSILIDAVQLVLGARADAGLVREGASRLEVTAEFEISPAQNKALAVWLAAWLDEAGFDHLDTLLLRRTVDLQGKSRAWVNGSPATATQLTCLAELDTHGCGQRPAGRLCKDNIKSLGRVVAAMAASSRQSGTSPGGAGVTAARA